MRTLTEGKNVLLYVYFGGVPKLTVCATNLTKKITAEQINITTIDSDIENEYIGGATDSELTLEGIRTLDTNLWEADDFEDNIGAVLQVLIIYTNHFGDQLSYDGNVLVTGVDDSNGASDFSSFSVSMVRSGAWTKLKTFNNILMDGDGNPIYDGDGNAIRVP